LANSVGFFDVYTAGWFNFSAISATTINVSTAGWFFLYTSVSPQNDTNYNSWSAMPNGWLRKCQSAYDVERELYAVVQMEAYNLHGVELVYYPATYNVSANRIWGEDNNRTYTSAIEIKSYYDLPKEEELWTKFGIEGIDNFHIYVNKMHFNAMTGGTGLYPISGGYTPKVGDALMAKYNGHFYEITDVSHEEEMFQQYKHAWDLTVRPFKDEFVGLNNTTSATEISAVTNQDEDIFDISDDINTFKETIIFSAGPCEEPKNNLKNGWW